MAKNRPARRKASRRRETRPRPLHDRATFRRIVKVLRKYGDELRAGRPEILAIRPGYKFRNGWFAKPLTPAIVVTMNRKRPASELLENQGLPTSFHGIPTDVKQATPFEQLRQREPELAASLATVSESVATEDLALPGWDVPGGPRLAPAALEAALALIPYKPPPNAPLDSVTGAFKVTCMVSPEHGWAQLQPFLKGVTQRFTVAMYDFTAPHIVETLASAMRQQGRQLSLILDPKVALPSPKQRNTSNKKNDIPEQETTARLAGALHQRLNFVWAAVTSKGKVAQGIFPQAYHTKVAVRDGSAFWLSSGNWQSSNQPDTEALNLSVQKLQQGYNREWHVILEHPDLATLFETYISWDIDQARPLQATAETVLSPDLAVELWAEPEAALAAKSYREFDPKIFEFSTAKPVEVQPLLTPDNYAEHALALIDSATKSIRFQNQYIKVTQGSSPVFLKLVNALREKQKEGLEVKIILRNEGDVRDMLEALVYESKLEPGSIRLQRGCHNKGIVIDSEKVLVGSHNWSSSGTTRNRDASLIFDDAGIAKYFAAIFDYDWKTLAFAHAVSETSVPRLATAATQGPSMGWADYYED